MDISVISTDGFRFNVCDSCYSLKRFLYGYLTFILEQMKLIALLSVSLIWGQLSTLFFFRSWVAFLGIVCCLIGLPRSPNSRLHILNLLFSKITESVFFGLLLFAGFYILYHHFECGKTELEVLVYFISAMVRLFFVLPQLSKKIDDIWRSVYGSD